MIGLSLSACGGDDKIVDNTNLDCLNCTGACKASGECNALLECADDCDSGDTACQAQCEAAHPAGKGLYDTARACMAKCD